MEITPNVTKEHVSVSQDTKEIQLHQKDVGQSIHATKLNVEEMLTVIWENVCVTPDIEETHLVEPVDLQEAVSQLETAMVSPVELMPIVNSANVSAI